MSKKRKSISIFNLIGEAGQAMLGIKKKKKKKKSKTKPGAADDNAIKRVKDRKKKMTIK
jgi:hypothetical protein